MEVVSKQYRESHARFLIQEGYFLIFGSGYLFTQTLIFSPAAILAHHGIELTLKGKLMWKQGQYPKSHELKNLIELSVIPNEMQHLLDKINTFYFHRYPMTKEQENEINQTLERINDNTLGIINEAGELGSDDWEKVRNLYKYLIQDLPKEFIQDLSTLKRNFGDIDRLN